MNIILSLALFASVPDAALKVDAVEQHLDGWSVRVTSNRVIKAGDIAITADGYVSNSSLDKHGIPKLSSLSNKDIREYREFDQTFVVKPKTFVPSDSIREECKESLEYRFPDDRSIVLTFRHSHHLNDHSPLLGKRKLTLKSREFVGECELDLTSHCPVSAMDKIEISNREHPYQIDLDGCIYFNAYFPGYDKIQRMKEAIPEFEVYMLVKSSYCFSGVKVKAGSKVRVKFHYRSLMDTDGSFHLRLKQYQDYATSWTSLGTTDISLTNNNQWIKFEQVIRLDNNANQVFLEFRFDDATYGQAWVDELTFEPVEGFILNSP